jgi:carbon starvation protein
VLIIAAFWAGDMLPVKGSKDVWFIVIFVYIVLASTLPVNFLFSPGITLTASSSISDCS